MATALRAEATTPLARDITAIAHRRVWAELQRAARALARSNAARRPLDVHGPRQSESCIQRLTVGGRVYQMHADVLLDTPDRPVVVVAIERSALEYPAGEELQRAFRLTPSEASVALLLAERRCNREIAQELGVSEHTARRHTEKVMRKLDVRRRTDVRRAILR